MKEDLYLIPIIVVIFIAMMLIPWSAPGCIEKKCTVTAATIISGKVVRLDSALVRKDSVHIAVARMTRVKRSTFVLIDCNDGAAQR